MSVVDWSLIAQVTVAVTAAMQIVKAKKPFNRVDGEYLAAGLGIGIAAYFCLMMPNAFVTWQDWMRCLASGLVAGVTASGAYNVQKALPFPNVLPTRQEKVAPTN